MILDIGRSKIIFDVTLDTINSPRSRTSPLVQYLSEFLFPYYMYRTFCQQAIIYMSCLTEWSEEWEREEGNRNTEFSAYIKSDGKSLMATSCKCARTFFGFPSYSLSLYMRCSRKRSLVKKFPKKNPRWQIWKNMLFHI